jgi:hypothetical protein
MLRHPIYRHIVDLEQQAADLTVQLAELRQLLTSGDSAVTAQHDQVMMDLDVIAGHLKAAQQQRRQLLLDLGLARGVENISRGNQPVDQSETTS